MTSLTGMEATGPWVKVDRAGRPTGKGLPELAAAGGIYGCRIDLGAGAG
jgi:hypothetical protein